MFPPIVTGFSGQYVGSGVGSTARSYWVQVVYPNGYSLLAGPVTLSNTAAALDSSHRVLLRWNPAPGAISYNVFYTTTTSLPGASASVLLGNVDKNSFEDNGSGTSTFVTQYGGDLRVAYCQYNFAVDGGATPITPAQNDIIPANAIVVGAMFNSTTALLAAGAATIAIGTTAGSSTTSLLAATGKASFSLDAVLTYLAGLGIFTGAPFKMTAAGQILLTIVTGPLTAGVLEIWTFYMVASNS
jgi:hypothetical protein